MSSERVPAGFSKEVVEAITQQVLFGGPPRTASGKFNKGTSGNPRGRPKRDAPSAIPPLAQLDPDSLSAIALRHGARTVKAQTEEGEVEITLREAAVTKMVREAIKGNTCHSRTFIQLLGRAEAEEGKRKREAFLHWSAVKERAAELYQQAERAGESLPLHVHPDDIVISADGHVTIVGPTTRGDIAEMRFVLRRVDFHIANIAYWQWMERRWTRLRGRKIDGCLYAELDFWDEQNELPPRLRLSVEEVSERLQSYARLSGRALHSILRKEAEPFEAYVPPRDMRVPLIVATAVLEFAKEKQISLKQLLPAWLNASSELWKRTLDEKRRSAPPATPRPKLSI